MEQSDNGSLLRYIEQIPQRLITVTQEHFISSGPASHGVIFWPPPRRLSGSKAHSWPPPRSLGGAKAHLWPPPRSLGGAKAYSWPPPSSLGGSKAHSWPPSRSLGGAKAHSWPPPRSLGGAKAHFSSHLTAREEPRHIYGPHLTAWPFAYLTAPRLPHTGSTITPSSGVGVLGAGSEPDPPPGVCSAP